MKESMQGSVDLGDVRASTLETIVDFLYTGEMSLDMDCLLDIVDAACHFQIQSAVDLCSDYITSILNFHNADDLIRIADMYSLNKVDEFYSSKILMEFEQFVDTPLFLSLTLDKLTSLLRDNRLRVKSEYQLIDAVIKWCAHDAPSRTEGLSALISCIRFPLMSKAQLQQLNNTALVSQCKSAATAVTTALAYHNCLVLGQHPSIVDDIVAHVRSSHLSLVLINQGSSLRPFEIVAYDSDASQFYSLTSDTDGGRDCRVVTAAGFAYILRVTDTGGGVLVNALVRFDPRHFTLTSLTPCSRLRLDPAVAAVKKQIFVFGGCIDTPSQNAGDTLLSSVDRYDIVSDRWTEVCPMPRPTHSHAAVAVQDVICVAGGVQLTEFGRLVTGDTFAYSPSDDTFRERAPMNCARRLHTLLALSNNNVLFAVGGIGDHHSFHQQTHIPVESYNITTNQWTILNSSTLAGRSVGHFAILPDDILISVGREHQQATEDDIWQYDIASDKWRPYFKIPSRSSLASTSCILLDINFYDEKLTKLARKLERR